MIIFVADFNLLFIDLYNEKYYSLKTAIQEIPNLVLNTGLTKEKSYLQVFVWGGRLYQKYNYYFKKGNITLSKEDGTMDDILHFSFIKVKKN